MMNQQSGKVFNVGAAFARRSASRLSGHKGPSHIARCRLFFISFQPLPLFPSRDHERAARSGSLIQ